MSIDVVLYGANGRALHTHPSQFDGSPQLVVSTPGTAHGRWNTIQGTVAGTIILAEVNAGVGLVLTDLVVSAKKKAGSTLDVKFTDDVDDEIILSPDTVTDRVNLSANYISKVSGWSGARLEVVTVADVIYTCFAAFYRIQETDSHALWDKKNTIGGA